MFKSRLLRHKTQEVTVQAVVRSRQDVARIAGLQGNQKPIQDCFTLIILLIVC